ncbi:TPA: hypothetical protein DIV45_00095 [Patescibacteria group bacterium]|nr:hypothetical protein [Patescibacteria group bacterium]
MLGVKPKVAILGVTGMIGSSVYSVLKNDCDLILVYRNADKLNLLNQKYGGVETRTKYQLDLLPAYGEYVRGFAGELHCQTLQALITELKTCDFVINALGIIKPYCDSDPGLAFFVNSVFPQVLATELGPKLIHITTDCVFSGAKGAPYDETAPKLPPDIYGITKALGEPEEAIVIRCSTIGPELIGNRGLLVWLISQKGQEINGYTNHWWNGITSIELSKVCQKIINGEVNPEPGIYHIFSDDITKHDLLIKLNQRFNLNCKVIPVVAPIAIDRRLRTVKILNQQLQILSIDEMIVEL